MPGRGEGAAAADRADLRLRCDALEERHVRALAAWLATAHESAPRGVLQVGAGGWEMELAADLQRIEATLPELAGPTLRRIAQAQRAFLAATGDRILARERQGRVRIPLGPPPCLRELRLGDDGSVAYAHPASVAGAAPPRDVGMDVANLALDLACGGRDDLAERLLASYTAAADDFSLYGVVDFFECACALSRAARVGRSVPASGAPRQEAAREALQLLHTALARRTRPLRPPVLVAVGGEVASGKSTVARALATRLGAPRIETDRVRDFLLGDRPGRTVHESQWVRSFEPGFEQEVYDEALRRAAFVLDAGRPLVIDACFARASQRAAARALARRCGRPFLFVECRAQPAVLSRRLADRDRAGERAGWAQIHRELAARWEPIADLAAEEHLVLDTSRPASETEAALDERVPRWSMRPGDERRDAKAWNARGVRAAAVTFDCWNTLLYEDDWPAAHRLRVAALERAAREAGRIVPFEDAGRAFDLAWERHMHLWRQGVATGAEEVARWALEGLGLEHPHPALEHLVRAYEEASHSGRVTALPGARETLEALAQAGVRRALVCDTGLTPGRVVRRHLANLGLLDLLEVLVFSDEVGVPKPDPRTFQAALDPLGVPPAQALHVGDLRHTDILGARSLGMVSVRIRARYDDTSALPEADFVVDSHPALLALLVRQ